MNPLSLLVSALLGLLMASPAAAQNTDHDERMRWWREARFGMFIHWGLYAIPAGEWNAQTWHGEWIRDTAQIPIDEYDALVPRFNPVNFDADAWALAAKNAGMKYIVITSKHHDGFCLFDSAHTDYDIMATPFKRDVLAELSEACHRHGLKICWYHSIMDWHHPDYLPRRGWEQDSRPPNDADFDRFVEHMKKQLRELLTNYGQIGVLWFDGEWENTWTHDRGQALYDYVRSIRPDIIINNRVDVGRAGMAGMTREGAFAGDFGTPEQEVPATGFPGVDWESCMTMNAHWGFNRTDDRYKSTEQLVRTLVDIASKGGNFLLNIGPQADGTFPQPSLDRLAAIGRWMDVNGKSIYATAASPFEHTPWGRCTQKPLADGNTRLYLHVFDWPTDGTLAVPGLLNETRGAYLLGGTRLAPLRVTRHEDAVRIALPSDAPDAIDSVVVLDIVGRPDTPTPPTIAGDAPIFIDAATITITTVRANADIRYTLDGSNPTNTSPTADGAIVIDSTADVRARLFEGGRPISAIRSATFTRVEPRASARPSFPMPGLRYAYFEGEWDALPLFDRLTPAATGVSPGFGLGGRLRDEHFGFRYTGYVRVPRDGMYTFSTVSDDGSRLSIGGDLVVDNDGLHVAEERSGIIALRAGWHPITVEYFERTGGDVLEVWYEGPGVEKQPVPPTNLAHESAD